MSRTLMEDEVFVRAYCAALTGLLTHRSLEPFDKKRVFVQEMCSAYAKDAVETWRTRPTAVPDRCGYLIPPGREPCTLKRGHAGHHNFRE